MPPVLDYIGLAISIVSLIITIATFIAANRVNKKISQFREQEDFYIHRDEIIAKLQGFILSVNNDCLQNNDNGKTLLPGISQNFTDLKTKYPHFSRRTRRCISSAQKLCYAEHVNWSKIANSLIALKNFIEREI